MVFWGLPCRYTLPRAIHGLVPYQSYRHRGNPKTESRVGRLGKRSHKGLGVLGMSCKSSWWFQPMSKILVKFHHFPWMRGENKKHLKSPPRLGVLGFFGKLNVQLPTSKLIETPQTCNHILPYRKTIRTSFGELKP